VEMVALGLTLLEELAGLEQQFLELHMVAVVAVEEDLTLAQVAQVVVELVEPILLTQE